MGLNNTGTNRKKSSHAANVSHAGKETKNIFIKKLGLVNEPHYRKGNGTKT